MTVEVLRRIGDIDRIAGRWDELAALDRRDGFFRTAGWYRAWMRHIRPGAEPFIVVVRDAADGIVAIAPLCKLSFRDLGFRLTALCWAGREVVSGDFLDLLAEPGVHTEAAQTLARFLWTRRAEWSLLMLGESLDGAAGLEGAVNQLAARERVSVRRQEERICPYIALPASFDEYLNSLGSSTRYHIRRRIRDVVEKRGAQIDMYTEGPAIVPQLDHLIRLHIARWNRDDQPGTFGRPGFAAFLHDICTNPPAGASVRLYVLRHEGAAAAALLTFYFGESALYYQAGWDPASPLASLSPGVVLMAESIRDAVARGCRYYEFLRGDENYKSRWTKSCRNTHTALYASGHWARAYLRLCNWKDIAKSRIPAIRQTAGRSGEPCEGSAS